MGTATTNLALALASVGHRVEILYVGPSPTPPSDPYWARLYESASVSIRMISRSHVRVEPAMFAAMKDVAAALHESPPDIVIAQDGAAPAYIPMRLRQLGLAFEDTLFVVLCHGTRGWIKDVSRNVRVFPHLLHLGVLERASVELADAVVSPSAYMVEWMRDQGWELPKRTVVVPYPTGPALGATSSIEVGHEQSFSVDRIAFFGRLDVRKGVRLFAEAVNALEPELLAKVDLAFLGAEIPLSAGEVESFLSVHTRRALRSVRFEIDLDQPQALERLARPGTLAVIPSLEDNSPNTVYECLQRGIPFLASARGGTSELIAPQDRSRVLFEPTADGIEVVLRRALATAEALRPARAAFNEAASLRAWEEVVSSSPSAAPETNEQPRVDVVVTSHRSEGALLRCLEALGRQRYRAFRVFVVRAGNEAPEVPHGTRLVERVLESSSPSLESARMIGLQATTAPYIVFLTEHDVPTPELLDTLVRAQQSSGADVCSCGFYVEDDDRGRTLRLFTGEPRGLGLIANAYGQVALLRRSLLTDFTAPWPVEGDADWPLLARLSTRGAKIVSVPVPLLTRAFHPGTIGRDPTAALQVVEQFEASLPAGLRELARLAAGLAAASLQSSAQDGGLSSPREQGFGALAVRAGRRLTRRRR